MIKLSPIKTSLSGTIEVPGDKSISHRSIILGALAEGRTIVNNFLPSEDCLTTINVFKKLGVTINRQDTTVEIEGKGMKLEEPTEPLYFGNSGTTARLMLGVLAGQKFFSSVYGDPYLTKRPMMRVIQPLRKMGANIMGRGDSNYLPLAINGKDLTGITYTLSVSSAQVKSAILLAGLYAEEPTTVKEREITRDHTERMLKHFGVDIKVKSEEITLKSNPFKGTTIFVPGDISSAAFFLVATLIVPESYITLKNVNLNPTRTGILEVLQKMGVTFDITNERNENNEPIGDITIKHQTFYGTVIEGELIPRLIDEIPIIALLATQGKGTTIIKNAEELRVKETDRIKATVNLLKTLGANIEETEDGMIIHGGTILQGGKVSSYYDHRIAMMGVIASLICEKDLFIDEIDSINISYPNFFEDLHTLTNK